MDRSQKYAITFAVFIAFVMLASSLVVFFGKNNSDNTPSNPSDNTSNPNAAPSVSFDSESFDANVSDVFPQIIVFGQTSEAIPGNIDAELVSIQGVTRISQSGYVGNPSSILSFKAELLLDPNSNVEEVFSRIVQGSKLLSNIQGVRIGLVELPSRIEVKNTDLNISRTFTPEQHFAQAFLSITTQKGDSIKASLNVSLANDVSSNLQVIETENSTSAPQFFSETVKAKVVELQKKLLVQGSMGFDNYVDSEGLKQSLISQEFLFNTANVSPLMKALTVKAKQPIPQVDVNEVKDSLDLAKIQDLNSFSVEKSEQDFTITASLKDGASLKNAQDSIKKVLSDFNISESSITFEPPEMPFMLDLNLSTTNSQAAFASLNDFFGPKGINFEAVQPLKTDLASVFIKDLNSTLPVDSNTLTVLAKPSHSIGEEIEFTLQVQVVRGIITQAQALEEKQ